MTMIKLKLEDLQFHRSITNCNKSWHGAYSEHSKRKPRQRNTHLKTPDFERATVDSKDESTIALACYVRTDWS